MISHPAFFSFFLFLLVAFPLSMNLFSSSSDTTKSNSLIVMSKCNAVVVPLIVLLISTSTFTQKFLVFASPVWEIQRSANRPDPLCRFRPYDGVYDIRNKHYWASAAFTGIHGYAIAGIWLIFGLGFGSYMIIKNFNGNSAPVANQPDSLYIIVFSFILMFTVFAIIAGSFQLAANGSCHQRGNELKETIFHAAGNTSQEMRRVINTLVDMQKYLSPYDAFTCNLLNVTTHRLRRESLTVQEFVKDIEQPSKEALGILYYTNLVAVVLNLVLLVAALVLGILHWQSGILVLIFCSWILTTFSWALTGFNYFFHTFAEDTCSAFKDFEKNPQDSSAQFINPCPDSTDAKKLLVQVGFTVHSFITMLNSKLTQLREVSGLEAGKKGSLGFWTFCDPFDDAPNYAYSPHICPKDTIPIGNLRNVLSRFTCHKGSSAAECLGDGKFLPESSYLMAGAYSQSIQRLLNVFPDLLSLTGCSSVKQAFSDIAWEQCKPFKRSARMLWSSSLSLSIIMSILGLLWVAKARQDRQRSFSKFSIVPNPA